MNLATALEQTVLSKATVVAGQNALHREIGWVHIVDHPEITNWLKPRELLLTTGYNWPSDDQASRELIRTLSDIGLAGVVLAVPHFREHFPAEAIEEANLCNFALLELPWEVPFSEITHDVLGRIINIQTEIIRRSDLIHRTLTNAAIQANNLESLADALSKALEKDVLIVSESGTLLGGSSAHWIEKDERALIRHLTARESLAEVFQRNEPVRFSPSEYLKTHRLGSPIRLPGEITGVVWLESETDDFEELDSRAVEHAAVIAALHLTHQRELSDQEMRLGYAFVAGLLEGKFSATPSAIERAQASGWSENRDYRVCLILLDEPIPLSLDGFNRRKRCASRVTSLMQDMNIPALLSVSLNQISFLLPGEVLPESIWKVMKQDGSAMAVSRVHRGTLGMSLGAQDVEALLPLLRPGRLHSFSEVLFPRALMGDADARSMLLERLIYPLANPKRGNSLIETVTTLSHEGFQLLNTAKALNIHISTLRYRVARIESILGVSLEKPEDRFQIQVAAEMYKLISED